MKSRISARTIEAMTKEYGTEPKDLICAVGPSICGECYEIGGDVADEFAENYTQEELERENILVPYPNGKFRLYLWNAIRYTLIKSGVKAG